MDRLFAYIGNDANLVRCAIHQHHQDLAPHLSSDASGWGMGHEQESQYLLRKKPQPHDISSNLMTLAGDLRTDAFLIHSRAAKAPHVIPADMQPFRFRSWLFAHTGGLGDYGEHHKEMELPDFLTRNIRGTTDSELLFHRFLMHLKNERVQLRQPTVPVKAAQVALARTLDEARTWFGEQGDNVLKFGVALINGRNLYAGAIGDAFRLYTVEGIGSCSICEGQPLFAGHRPKKISHKHFRAVILVSDRAEQADDSSGVQVKHQEIVTVGSDLKVQRASIEGLLGA